MPMNKVKTAINTANKPKNRVKAPIYRGKCSDIGVNAQIKLRNK